VTLTTTPHELFLTTATPRVLVRAMEEGRWPYPAQILVRLHPRDDLSHYEPFARTPHVILEKPFRASVRTGDGLAVDITQGNQRHLADTLRHSDVVVNVASTIAIEAAIFDTPVVNIAFDGDTPSPFARSARRYYRFTHYANITRQGAVRVAETPEDLVSHVGRYLADPVDRPRRSTSRRARAVPVSRRSVGRARGSLRHRGAADAPGWCSIPIMCGIAGFVSLTGRPPDPRRLARMVGTLRHRGPDDQDFVGPAALGAARLSVIDVVGGHQPITIDGGAVTVAQNGEIYNFVELREELARAGRHTTTTCDTEVIAHLYAMTGSPVFVGCAKLAVAIWDAAAAAGAGARPCRQETAYYIDHLGEWLFDPRRRRCWRPRRKPSSTRLPC
jgi:hypothetical protein